MENQKITNPASQNTDSAAIAGMNAVISKSDVVQDITEKAVHTDDINTQMAEKIIKEQEGIIGPVAYEQATKVQGILIDQTTHKVTLQGDKKIIIENLVKQYEQLFGRISIAICKEAVRGVIANAPTDQVPQILL